MRRDAGQPLLAAVAVVPSLAAFALVLGHPFVGSFSTSLFLLAGVLVATLAVDRWLVRSGDAPAGWMALRVPLSLGLAALTALAGLFS